MLVAIFVPPLLTEGRKYEYVETIQFALAAMCLPALVVVGYPLELVSRYWPSMGARFVGMAERRRHHPGLGRALVPVAVDGALVIVWRTPALMDALARHRWLVVVEVVSVAAVGIWLWFELLASPPFHPRVARPWRAVLAALIMWTIWIVSFIVAFSSVPWYVAFHHGGHGISAGADQQIATGMLWVVALGTYLPVIFSDMMAWLKNGEDPDAELRRLVRAERRSGGWSRPGSSKRWRVPGPPQEG